MNLMTTPIDKIRNVVTSLINKKMRHDLHEFLKFYIPFYILFLISMEMNLIMHVSCLLYPPMYEDTGVT